MFRLDRKILIVLGVFVVALVAVLGLNGKITGNAFAYNLPQSCTDSDGGDNPSEKGTVNFKDRTSVKAKSATDKCHTAGLLLEHYCGREKYHFTRTVSCRCEDGACK